jgi:hypothetical protein
MPIFLANSHQLSANSDWILAKSARILVNRSSAKSDRIIGQTGR